MRGAGTASVLQAPPAPLVARSPRPPSFWAGPGASRCSCGFHFALAQGLSADSRGSSPFGLLVLWGFFPKYNLSNVCRLAFGERVFT